MLANGCLQREAEGLQSKLSSTTGSATAENSDCGRVTWRLLVLEHMENLSFQGSAFGSLNENQIR